MIATTEAKCAALRQHGGLNPHPERIVDPLFQEHEFFDRRDFVQVRYEMLRRVRIEGHSVATAAAAFGCSRFAFYEAKDAYQHGGLPGLIRRRSGPRRRHKLTEPILARLHERCNNRDPALNAETLVRLIRDEFGVHVHPRSIERALVGPLKKGRRFWPPSALPNSGPCNTSLFVSAC
jgi:transposase